MKNNRGDIISFCSYTAMGMHEYRDGLLPHLSVLYSARLFIVHELRDIKQILHLVPENGRIIIWLSRHLSHLTGLVTRLSGCEVAFIGENYCRDQVPVFHKPGTFSISQKYVMLYTMICKGMSRHRVARRMQIDVKKLYSMENYLQRRVEAPNRIVLYAFPGVILHMLQSLPGRPADLQHPSDGAL